MAHIYQATLSPNKMELLSVWLPAQPWFREGDPALHQVGAYRFDDPAGEVGMETILVAAGDTVLQNPLTYRGAPLEGAEQWLIGTMEHSVLGTRWVYDACGDPVYVAELAAALVAGRPQAEEMVDVDGQSVRREPSVRVQSSASAATDAPVPSGALSVTTAGGVTTISDGELELSVLRVLDLGGSTTNTQTLTATWDGQTVPVQLASAKPAV
ncbi:hypothetical protein AL755_04930 [Arthrobacter sp. ERGS1:01]|uniref:CG0192-related protein n=1 Tax=Arthrobacter sp. ERGS1:01 TaxID=1704044 RepID=UPI0006B64573|nr:hypothetical protein [Arthrobacter sp. ERGS1:01]ALE07567.1 hypothetical protein AL755_04930 [Arthrobacter sp. ERGS1:01]